MTFAMLTSNPTSLGGQDGSGASVFEDLSSFFPLLQSQSPPLNPQPERFLFFVEKIISLAYLEYIQSRPRYRNITSIPNAPQQTWLHAKEA